MLLPCKAILEEPEGFHLKKKKTKRPKQAAISRRVRTREGPSVKDSERNSTPS